MTQYRKTVGNKWVNFYKIDIEAQTIKCIEERWKDKIGGDLEGYFINCMCSPLANYDTRLIKCILDNEEKMTVEDWDKVKKAVNAYVRQQ
jgi:hypothetical protein